MWSKVECLGFVVFTCIGYKAIDVSRLLAYCSVFSITNFITWASELGFRASFEPQPWLTYSEWIFWLMPSCFTLVHFFVNSWYSLLLILILFFLWFYIIVYQVYRPKNIFWIENQANVSTKHADKKIIAATKYSFLTINVIELKLSSLLFYLSSLRC